MSMEESAWQAQAQGFGEEAKFRMQVAAAMRAHCDTDSPMVLQRRVVRGLLDL